MSCSKPYVFYDLSEGTLSRDYVESDSEESLDSESEVDEINESLPARVNTVTIHKHQRELNINGVPVKFPGKPYPTQIKMMESVIEGFDGEANNLIESPTGTGKTLALLCAALAWRKERNFKGKIYYTTRTHSQVSGVVKELKKTVYARGIEMTILGSRKQLCINPDRPVPEDGKGISVDAFCQKLRLNHFKRVAEEKKLERDRRKNVENESDDEEKVETVARKKSCKSGKTCGFYFGTDTGEMGDNKILGCQVLNIEDYRERGAENGICPYFTTMYRHKEADLIICPYNYIVSRQLRRTCQIKLKESLVIFDEGHNLEKACCDEASISLQATKIISTIRSCKAARTATSPAPPPEVQVELENLETDLSALVSLINRNQEPQSWSPQKSMTVKTNDIFQELNQCGLGLTGVKLLYESLKKIRDREFADCQIYLSSDVSKKIRKILGVLEYLHSGSADGVLQDYQLFISGEYGDSYASSLEIKCMNPGVVFKDIEEATTSVTITSGTLAPLNSFSRELKADFGKPLSLDQSIPSSRYFIGKVSHGPIATEKKSMNFCLTLKNRGSEVMLKDVGYAVLKLCKAVPNGVIVFVPSAYYLNELLKEWKKSGILAKIRRYKHVFSEADKTVEKLEEKFKKKSKSPGKNSSKTGALLMAYFRGTMSEGVDFKDEEARLVITLGIPLMPFTGPEASARRRYYSNDKKFDDWYYTNAFRAFNQGIGRCVRHRQDWGAVIMLESRLCDGSFDAFLPGWIRKACKDYRGETQFDKMLKDLKAFVQGMIDEDSSACAIQETDDTAEDVGNRRKLGKKGKVVIRKKSGERRKVVVRRNVMTRRNWGKVVPRRYT